MNIGQALKMAFKSLRSNKLRAILTMLGVIIGVFAVTAVIALVSGASNEIISEIRNQGSNLIVVSCRRINSISNQDVGHIKQMDGVNYVSPYLLTYGFVDADIDRIDPENQNIYIEGVNSQYAMIRSIKMKEGRFISQEENDNFSFVAVVGTKVAENIFGRKDVVGEFIKIDNYKFKIVGVLKETGTTLFSDSDNRIIIPFDVAQTYIARQSVTSELYISATDESIMTSLSGRIQSYFVIAYNRSNAVDILSMSDITDMVNKVMNLMTIVLSTVAGISLLVGGIGIMNIMLVSVAERTREIGIRKAIGAKRYAILTQFLIESITLTLLGGLLGILLSVLVISIMAKVIGIGLTISASSILLGVGFSVVVGLLFGMYPAIKASAMHPIDALRRE